MTSKGPMTEEKAVKALERLAKRWPKSLWLFSANGTLCVMRCDEHGEHVLTQTGGVDQEYVIATIDIPNSGGDW